MEHSIDRRSSPLYEAIREIMAGSWPEDEYDVAESPLSYVDYKSQVFLDLEDPVSVIVGGRGGGGSVEKEKEEEEEVDTSGTDFESLESDRSTWGDEADDTLATEPEVDAGDAEKKTAGGSDGWMLQELFEEIDRAKEEAAEARGRESVREMWREGKEQRERAQDEGQEGEGEEEAEGDSDSDSDSEAKWRESVGSSALFRSSILEGPDDSPASLLESTIETRAEGRFVTAATTPIDSLFRLELTAEVDRAFNNLATISPPHHSHTPTPELPPPIPSRSPSRPTTSRAIVPPPPADPTGVFPLTIRAPSTISLTTPVPPASSMSSPRSSRFFEELGDTGVEMKQEGGSGVLPPPGRIQSDEVEDKEPGTKTETETETSGAFWAVCGLDTWFRRVKFKAKAKGRGEGKVPTAEKGRNRATSVVSFAKKW